MFNGEKSDTDEDSIMEIMSYTNDSEIVYDHQEESGLYVQDYIVPAASEYAEFIAMIRYTM